jgi:hypothetical protein
MVVGQKVVCVDDNFPPEVAQFYIALPKKDQIYVIRNVVMGVNWKAEPGEVCLYLVGLNNPRSDKPPFPERGFNSERFRPLNSDEDTAELLNIEPAELVGHEPAEPPHERLP